MTNLKHKKRIHLPVALKGWSVILFLFFYVLGLHIQDFHKILHNKHEQNILHSPQQEEDPCHRNVFHHEKKACQHKTHITSFEKCSLCEWTVYKEQWIASNDPIVTINNNIVINNSVIEFLITDLSIHLCSRAPPVF